MRPTLALILSALAVVFAGLPEPADARPRASSIAFMCGPNTMDLCTIRADGSGRRQITRGDAVVGGTFGQVSRAGSRVAFIHRDRTIRVRTLAGRRIARVKTRYDNPETVELDRGGRRLLWVEPAPRGARRVCRGRIGTRAPRCFLTSRVYQAWGPKHTVLSTESIERSDICVERPPSRCGRRLARAPRGTSFYTPSALSPNGRRVVAIQEYRGQKRVVLFSARTGRRLGVLTKGHRDGNPTWSPDGRWIAFDRDNGLLAPRPNTQIVVASLWRVPARGGRALRVTRRGYQPAWGR